MISQKSFHPYPSYLLPDNFRYPQKYLELSQSTDTIPYDEEYGFPWWFEDYGTEGAQLLYEYRNYDIPNLNLIPFANNGDWKASFDANDTSGNPKVIVNDSTDSPFYTICDSFDEWLDLAVKDTW